MTVTNVVLVVVAIVSFALYLLRRRARLSHEE
jgi:hypothetical protein